MRLVSNVILQTKAKRAYVYVRDNKSLVIIVPDSGAIYAYKSYNPFASFFEPALDDTVSTAQRDWQGFPVDIDIADWRVLQKNYGEGMAVHHILERIVRS